VYIYRLVQIIASKQDLTRIFFFFFYESLIVTVKQYNSSTAKCYKTLLRKTNFPDHVVPHHAVMHIMHVIQDMKVIQLSKCIYGAINATE